MINIEQHIEETFSQNIKTFIGDRQWDVGYCQVKIFGGHTEYINWLIYEDVLDYIVQQWREVAIEQAALALRQQIYHKTGKRIWALEFRLYPNGEFDIEYNFVPPRGYIEQAGFDFEASLQQHAHQQSETVISMIEDLATTSIDLSQLYQNCRTNLQNKNQEMSRRGIRALDLEVLDLAQNPKQLKLSEQLQTIAMNVIGTFQPDQHLWQWAWADLAIKDDLGEVSHMVLDYGQIHAIESLQQAQLYCHAEDAWNFTALAVDLAAADGAYCVKQGEVWTYVVFLYIDEQQDWEIAS